MDLTPEQKARADIDAALTAAGWTIQNRDQANLSAARGVAIREFALQKGHGTADYVLYVDGKAAGVVEAKKQGETLTGVEVQAERYSEGLPDTIPAHIRPLPFLDQSTGVETRFTNRLDPAPRSRRVFHFHRPETLAKRVADSPGTRRSRLRQMPPLDTAGLWSAQQMAVENLEESLAADRPRALIQMATGSGKTFPFSNATSLPCFPAAALPAPREGSAFSDRAPLSPQLRCRLASNTIKLIPSRHVQSVPRHPGLLSYLGCHRPPPGFQN